MDKDKTMVILEECLNSIKSATPEEIEEFQRIYDKNCTSGIKERGQRLKMSIIDEYMPIIDEYADVTIENTMTTQQAIHCIKAGEPKYSKEFECYNCELQNSCDGICNRGNINYGEIANDMAIKALEDKEELDAYRKLGTVEQLSKSIDEEDVLKFYYCESRDEYYVGKRCETMYYAKVLPNTYCLSFCMSRYLPWGKCVVNPGNPSKEYTYPSEPKEIYFPDWLKGWVNKYIKTCEVK